MRAKKATKSTKPTKPARSIRYLLSADRRLQKLSLRKMSNRPKNGKQPPQSIQSKKPAAAKQPPRQPWETRWPAIAVGVVCVVVAAALISAPQPSLRRDAGAGEVTRAATAPQTSGPAAARPEARKAGASKPAAPAAAPAPRTPDKEVATAKLQPTEPVKAPVAVESTVTAAAPNSAPVTITGCVQLVGERFWLDDTSGAEAPKARSWKTGFLKKRPSRIELVDATSTLTLSNHVGQRVAATGILMNREMRARSMRRVAASCN